MSHDDDSGRQGWLETFRALGEALLDVLRAEMAVLAERWKRSARELAIAMGLFTAAISLLIHGTVPLLVFASMAAVHELLGWPWWGAALSIAGLSLALAVVAAMLARYVVENRFESFLGAAQERFADHVGWWWERILGDERRLAEGGGDEPTKGIEAGSSGDGEAPPPPADG